MTIYTILAIPLVAWHSLSAQDAAGPATLSVDPSNLVESITYDLGDRLLTVQEVTEEVLPTPPNVAEPSLLQQSSLPRNPALGLRSFQTLSFGATVYRTNAGPTRSLVSYHPKGGTDSVTFWSSADWSLLANMGRIEGVDGKECQLMIMWSTENMDQREAFFASHGNTYHRPDIPLFTAGKASYLINGGTATTEMTALMGQIHATYDVEYQRLQEIFLKREVARVQNEAELKAHPPEQQDVLIQFRLLEPGQLDPK